MAKAYERQMAREIRANEGLSVKAIARRLGVSKSSVSVWVRDIELSVEQRRKLSAREISNRKRFIRTTVRKSSQAREMRWARWKKEAHDEFLILQQNPEFMYLIGLYVGEGSKSEGSAYRIAITNGSPDVIRAGLRLMSILGVPEDKWRLSVNVHLEINSDEGSIRKYWERETGVRQIRVQYDQRSRSNTKGSSNRRPFGICQLRANSTEHGIKVREMCRLAQLAYQKP